jgi:predicted RNase H-like nuclease (RuvC/YqgF family)
MNYTSREIALINETSAWKRQIAKLRAENEELRDQVRELAVMLERYKRESRRSHV